MKLRALIIFILILIPVVADAQLMLKQSTSVTLQLGPFLDSTDGITEEEGLTLSQADYRLSKNGGNIAQKSESSSGTHDELGYYDTVLDATDTNTLGILRIIVHESGALPVWQDLQVVTANVWDSLFSTDKLEVDLLQMGGVAQSATDLKDLADDGYNPSTDKVTGVVLVDTVTTNSDQFDPSATGVELVDSGGTAGTSADELIDDIWDEILTGATHNIATSAGRRLRQITDIVVHSGTAQGPGGNSNQIILDVGASATDGAYDPSLVAIVVGIGAGQARNILEYDGATKTATVDRNWKVLPSATSEFVIYANAGREHVNEGLAMSAGSATIELNALASSTNDAYNNQTIFIRSGLGDDQSRIVSDYVGATRVATVNRTWDITPDNTSAYVMLALQMTLVNEMRDAILSDSTAFNGADIGAILTDVTSINGDSMRGTDFALLASSAPTNWSDLAITVTTGRVTVGTNNDKTGYSITGTINDLDALDTALDSAHGAGSWASAVGFSTFDETTDDVFLANGAHGGAAAAFTLADYSDFQGSAGGNVTVEAFTVAGLNQLATQALTATTPITNSALYLAQGTARLGDGLVAVNHDTGGTNALQYSASGVPVGGATIKAYRKTDYDASAFTVRGQTVTDDNGQWVTALNLSSGVTYIIQFESESHGPDTSEVTVP